jgi:hypothetical protein
MKKYKTVSKFYLQIRKKAVPLRPGKSYTASSLRIPQGLIAARVVGCSGAI